MAEILRVGSILKEKDSRFPNRRIQVLSITATHTCVISNQGFRSKIRLDRVGTNYLLTTEKVLS